MAAGCRCSRRPCAHSRSGSCKARPATRSRGSAAELSCTDRLLEAAGEASPAEGYPRPSATPQRPKQLVATAQGVGEGEGEDEGEEAHRLGHLEREASALRRLGVYELPEQAVLPMLPRVAAGWGPRLALLRAASERRPQCPRPNATPQRPEREASALRRLAESALPEQVVLPVLPQVAAGWRPRVGRLMLPRVLRLALFRAASS